MQAEHGFRQALAPSPDLDAARGLAALVEIDQGRAREAMVRLIARGLACGAEPALFTALVQACRYCGLLEPSVEAHYRARALDSTVATSGSQSLWQLGDEEGALREGIRPDLLRAIVIGMRGDAARAIALLRELEPLRAAADFRRLRQRSRAAYLVAVEEYRAAGGEALLGPVLEPEEVERLPVAALPPQRS